MKMKRMIPREHRPREMTETPRIPVIQRKREEMDINVDLRSATYGCEYLTSINYLDDELTSNEKLYPWIADFEQKVIAESE